LYALNDLRISPTLLGIVIGCGGVGALIGAALAAPVARRLGTRRCKGVWPPSKPKRT
jgi:hypothetical protein